MATSPKTTFKFENLNTAASTPTLGLSHIVARTTKGPFNKPDVVFANYEQFEKVYGKEIVPDGSVSNIQRAFQMGSTLRVSRVAGASNPSKGIAVSYDPDTGTEGSAALPITIVFTNPVDSSTVNATLHFETREFGSSIVNPDEVSKDLTYYAQLIAKVSGSSIKYYLKQFKNYIGDTPIANDIMDETLMLTTSSPDFTSFTDVSALSSFIELVPNVELIFDSCTDTSITNLTQLISWINSHNTWRSSIGNIGAGATEIILSDMAINEGSDGGASTPATWYEAYQALRYHVDSYQLILSHVHQHLPLDWVSTYKSVADVVVKDFESELYVEIPKTNSDGDIASPLETLTLATSTIAAIGQDKAIAYFLGGIKFYDMSGNLMDNDVLGTVIGLGDTSASAFGPYYSFAGMNRGLVTDSQGPSMENLGSPNLYEELQKFAEINTNLFVVKDTPSNGKQTMMWHNFSSTPFNNSDKFLSSVRLQLYMKKVIRPIIFQYIEEPNYIPTWKLIYQKVKKIMDPLVNVSFSEYRWIGDQDASGYSDMSMNNESDVRSGKYKAKMVYKDIVTLQEVEITFSVDSSNQSITTNTQ